ncbi:hypothetical protein ACVIW3_003773 [Bradyrhizobium diazoefficiens]
MMRIAFATAMALLLGISPGQAQIATTGSTAMDLPTVPGAIVISPLNSPGPFSATTVPGVPDTTLAPVPLASDPTTPGTVVVCAPPATSPTPLPATPTVSSTGLSTSGIAAPILPVTGQNGSSIGTISTAAPAGTGATVACSSTPGGQVTSAASLPLSIPQVPASPAPGHDPGGYQRRRRHGHRPERRRRTQPEQLGLRGRGFDESGAARDGVAGQRLGCSANAGRVADPATGMLRRNCRPQASSQPSGRCKTGAARRRMSKARCPVFQPEREQT